MQKNVICEKPFTPLASEAEELISLGSLMDINMYNIHFVTGLLGTPDEIEYFAGKHENGVDLHGTVLLQYGDVTCQCTGAKDCWCENGVQILGDKGYISVGPASNNCQSVRLVRKGMEDVWQQMFNCIVLMKMNEILGNTDDVSDLREEYEHLWKVVNEKLWNDEEKYFFDLWKGDRQNGVKHIGAYWALLAKAVPPEKLDDFVAHLENKKEFCRPPPVPTLSADHAKYNPEVEEVCVCKNRNDTNLKRL